MRGALGAAPGKTLRRRRIAHAGVILAQDGSWRFFDRGGEGGDAGRETQRENEQTEQGKSSCF